jgi:hypothetical protein
MASCFISLSKGIRHSRRRKTSQKQHRRATPGGVASVCGHPCFDNLSTNGYICRASSGGVDLLSALHGQIHHQERR